MEAQPVFLVRVAEAKPNPLFTEEQRALVRFLRYNLSVPCSECGRRSRTHWTMTCSFEAMVFPKAGIFLQKSGKVHLPFAPVCTSHPTAPARPTYIPREKKEA